jgi:hypothetical protein
LSIKKNRFAVSLVPRPVTARRLAVVACALGLGGVASLGNGCGALVGLTDLPPPAGPDASAPDGSDASAHDASDATAHDASDATVLDAADSAADSSLSNEGAADASAEGCSFAGLEAYYPLNGDTLDHSGNGGFATSTDTSFVDGGKLGELALLFPEDDSGTGGTFAINKPEYTFAGGGTMCTWFYAEPVADQSYGLPLFVGGPRGMGDFFSLQVQNAKAPWCGPTGEIFHDHWGGSCEPANALASTEVWNYVCIAMVPAAGPVQAHVDVFLNGFVSTLATPAFEWSLSLLSVGSNFIDGTSTNWYFFGRMNEVSIWSRGLALNEMEALYNGGQGCKPHP